MQNFKAIIIGVLMGLSAVSLMLLHDFKQVAYGEESESSWNDTVAKMENLKWGEVFGVADSGKNIYAFVYQNLAVAPSDDALEEVAKKNGLLLNEAQAVVDGGIEPIFNNPDRQATGLTQEDAYLIMKGVQDDYADLKELFELSKVVEMSIMPGEIFANGDSKDSGFDLIADLNKIEEILFLDTTKLSVGAPFKNALKSPYNPTEDEKYLGDYVANPTPAAVLTLEIKKADQDSAGGKGVLRGNIEPGANSNVGILNVGEKEFELEILEEDVCPDPNILNDALDNFDKEKSEVEKVANDKKTENGKSDNEDRLADSVFDNQDEKVRDEVPQGLQPDGELLPAAPGIWGSVWCPGLSTSSGGAGAGVSGSGVNGKRVGVGPGGFSSLGGVATDSIFAGAGDSVETKAFSLNVGLCFDVQAIKGTVSSYQAGDSCVSCEIENINNLLDETLSKSLVPNKATGNMMESAKCKDTGSLFNLQFITIWNPIPTPSNDQLILGKNIFEEWNKFVKRYAPLSPGKSLEDSHSEPNAVLDQQKGSLPAGTSEAELTDRVSEIVSKYAAEAALSVENYEVTNEATNIMLYSQNVLGEMKQMNSLFKNFKNTYTKVDAEALKKIIKKPDKG